MRILTVFCIIAILMGCSTHNIKKEISEADQIKEAGKIIVIVRISSETVLVYNQFVDNFKVWFAGRDSDDKISFAEENEMLSKYKSDNDRFYQEGAGRDFLKYKSLGILKTFAAENRSEIQSVIRNSRADAALIYEIGGSFSRNMKVIKYDSVISVINRDNEIIYLDHQKKFINDGDYDRDLIEREFFDIVSRRLYFTLEEMGFILKK
ncbi:MAG: hypothetical protein PF637_05620 [Spirochaetes bacterium]|jgi:hypothetical protein|nr:hypothetical protein [Spirochaetota bacterium]